MGNPAFYGPDPASPGFNPESILRDLTTHAVDYIRARAGETQRTPFLFYWRSHRRTRP
jgi:hypothetical protein